MCACVEIAVVSSSLAVCLSSTKLRLSSKLRSVQNCPLRTRSSKHAHSRFLDKQRQHREEQRRRWRERADNQPFNPSDTGKRKRDDEADVKIEYTKGLILKLNTDDTTLTREDIKTEVMKYGKAAFVDFHSGSTEGYVRMQTPEMSNAVVAAMARVDVDASAPAAEASAAEAQHLRALLRTQLLRRLRALLRMVPQHQYQKLAMMLNRKHVSLWSCWVGMRRRHIGGKLKHTRRQRSETEPAVAGVDMEIGIEKQCPDHK